MINQRRNVENILTGSMTTRRATPLPVRRGPAPPSWWVDDGEATDDNFRAMQELTERG